MITTMDASTGTDDTEHEPTQQPTWWNLYAALAAHGEAHPGLQPVQVEPPSPQQVHQHGDIIAALQLTPRPDRYDATVFADWVQSLDTNYGITAAFLAHPSDTLVTAVGTISGLTVALWTVVHGMPVNLPAEPHDRPVVITVDQLRAVEFDQHTRGQLTAASLTGPTNPAPTPPAEAQSGTKDTE